MISSSSQTELFDPGRWPMRFLLAASDEPHIDPLLAFSALLHPMVSNVTCLYVFHDTSTSRIAPKKRRHLNVQSTHHSQIHFLNCDSFQIESNTNIKTYTLKPT